MQRQGIQGVASVRKGPVLNTWFVTTPATTQSRGPEVEGGRRDVVLRLKE